MDKLDDILRSYTDPSDATEEKVKVFGAAFVVVTKDGVLYEGAAGRSAEAYDSPLFTTKSFTWIASMTKIFTAPCLMQIIERSLIKLDDDVRSIVPELAEMQILKGFSHDGQPILVENHQPITLRQLLTHTVGLSYDIADPDLNKWSLAVGRKTTNLSYTLEGWNTPLKFVPGNGWCYGSAVDWAAQVLTRTTKQSLEHYMTENIFEPLEMKDTSFHSTKMSEETRSRIVPCAFRDAENGKLANGPLPIPRDPPVESGGAGLWSTAFDLAKVLQSLLKADSGESKGAIVSRKTAAEMLRPQLNEKQRNMLQSSFDPSTSAMASEFPIATPLDHGISGIINTENVPGKRKKGSMTWLGMANGHWWIDRDTGIAATLFVNVLPLPDLVVNRLYDDLERAVYGDLLPSLAN